MANNEGGKVRKAGAVFVLLVFWVLMFLMNPSVSLADDGDAGALKYNLGDVIVSATKTQQYQGEVGSSTTVITSEELAKKGKMMVLDVLREVPGVSVMQYGGFGGATSIYIRGSKAGHTLVMLDGVELNDPTQASRSFDLGHLLVDNIERIEVVRGPQSTLYGSDAIGGVINIVTKKGSGDLTWDTFIEGGSYNTFREKIGLSGSTAKMDYSLSALRMDSDGTSKAAGTEEKDGYENTTLSAKFGYKVFDQATLDVVFRQTDAVYEYDDAANQDDPNKTGWWKNSMGRITFDQAVNEFWDQELSLSCSKTTRKYLDEADQIDTTESNHNWFSGDVRKFAWQHNVYPVAWSTLTGGFEYEIERGFGDGRKSWDRIDRKKANMYAFYIQNQFRLPQNLSITPGLRLDDHDMFGREATYKISASYLIDATLTRLKGNWGTGFKAPSLYQLYSTYGDTGLSPDKSRSYDFGFEQGLFDNKVNFGVTYFNNSFDKMIDFDMNSYTYQNIDNAETKGGEFEVSYDPVASVALGANYTYTRTRDKGSGKELSRRPENQIGLNMDWGFIAKANLNVSVNYVGSRFNDAANTIKMKAYTTVDINTSYNVTDDVQVFCRLENLLDKSFQQVNGYANPGSSYYVGLKASF